MKERAPVASSGSCSTGSTSAVHCFFPTALHCLECAQFGVILLSEADNHMLTNVTTKRVHKNSLADD